MLDSRSDSEIVRSSLSRSADFEQIFRRHWDPVFRFFESRVGPGLAEDLASEVFRIAFERRSSYVEGASGTCRPEAVGPRAEVTARAAEEFVRFLTRPDASAAVGDGRRARRPSAVAIAVIVLLVAFGGVAAAMFADVQSDGLIFTSPPVEVPAGDSHTVAVRESNLGTCLEVRTAGATFAALRTYPESPRRRRRSGNGNCRDVLLSGLGRVGFEPSPGDGHFLRKVNRDGIPSPEFYPREDAPAGPIAVPGEDSE